MGLKIRSLTQSATIISNTTTSITLTENQSIDVTDVLVLLDADDDPLTPPTPRPNAVVTLVHSQGTTLRLTDALGRAHFLGTTGPYDVTAHYDFDDLGNTTRVASTLSSTTQSCCGTTRSPIPIGSSKCSTRRRTATWWSTGGG